MGFGYGGFGFGGGGTAVSPLSADLDVGAYVLKSTTGSVSIDATATAAGSVILKADATGSVQVRREGGTPGSAEITFTFPSNNPRITDTTYSNQIRFTAAGMELAPANTSMIIIDNNTGMKSNSSTCDIGYSGGYEFQDCYLSRHLRLKETSSTPASVTSSGETVCYMKADKYVIAWNHAGTAKYRYLDLTSTDATWTYTTTAP